MRRKSFIGRHWQGDHSLVQMSFINFLSINLLVMTLGALPAVVFIVQNPVIRERFQLAYLMVIFAILLPWQWVGMVRGLRFDWVEVKNHGGVVMALLISVFSTFLLFYYVLPSQSEWETTYQTSFNQDPYHADLYVDGSRLVLSGELHYGTAAKAKSLVRAHNLTELQIDVSAGHLYEARELAYLVQDKQLDVRVTEVCLSPCTLVLAAGKSRSVAPGARIGFQSYKALFPDKRSSWFVEQNTKKDLNWLLEQGVAPAFVYQSFYLHTLVDYWEPGLSQLLESGFIDAVEQREQERLQQGAE